MKGRLFAFVGVICIVSLVAFGAFAKGKPVKPDKPVETAAECIVFTQHPGGEFANDGYLEGGQAVEGCCPNSGPFPAYTMTLQNLGFLNGTYDGQLFMNFYGAGRNQQYKVQFWTYDFVSGTPGDDDVAIEIIGGVINNDKKAGVLTVTFEDATGWDYKNDTILPNMSFVLVRTSDPTDCEE